MDVFVFEDNKSVASNQQQQTFNVDSVYRMMAMNFKQKFQRIVIIIIIMIIMNELMSPK